MTRPQFEMSRRTVLAGACAMALAACSRGLPGALDVPHIAQEPLLCVPTAAAMVLAYYGDPQPPRRLKSLAMGRAYDPSAPFDDFSATLYRDLIHGLTTLGYGWRELSFATSADGFAAGLALIEGEIARGRPLLIDVSIPYGHTLVVNAISRSAQAVTVVDPERAGPGRRTITFDELAAVWNESAYGGDFRAVMTTGPKRG